MHIHRSTHFFVLIALSLAACQAFGADLGAAPQTTFLDELQKAVAVAAVLVGGAWAYFRFVRFRTLKKRVEFNFDWATAILEQGRVAGVLTVKLTNKGNTQIELRKDQHYRCPLTCSLIPNRPQSEPWIPVTLYPDDLSPTGFIFKAHKRIEPGETIDDVAVLSLDASSSIAIQFNAEVLTLNARGGREQIASSMIAFPLGPTPMRATACSEDEQDDYDETKELREILRGWIGEARNLIGRGKVIPQSADLSALKVKAETLVEQLVGTVSDNVLSEAKKCADSIAEIVGPYIRQ
jgi:hypothetical protein